MGKYSIRQIHDALKETNFYTDKVRYVIVKLDKKIYSSLLQTVSKITHIYLQIIHDKDELSLVVPKEIWEEKLSNKYERIDQTGDLALITCEVKSETVTGYLLTIVSILSPHNIGVFVQGAFTTDHIFVDYKNLNEALELLNQLKS